MYFGLYNFWSEMNHKISQIKGLHILIAQDNTRWVRCTDIVFASYNFLVPVVAEWYSFHCCGRHTNNMIFNQNEQVNISFERVAEDNTRWVRCTSIHIEYKNIVFASYHFSVPLVVEWYTFRCCGRYTNNMIFDQKWTIKYLRWKYLRWKKSYYSGQHQMGWVHYHPQSVLEH